MKRSVVAPSLRRYQFVLQTVKRPIVRVRNQGGRPDRLDQSAGQLCPRVMRQRATNVQEMSHMAHTDYIVPDAPAVASVADHLRSVDCRAHTRKAALRRPAGEERTSCLLTIQFRLKGGNQRQSVIRLGFNGS